MKVLFCSYQNVSMPGGGVRTQILKTKEYLERLGIQVELFNPWRRYEWEKIDLIHLFQTDMSNYFLISSLPQSVPLVVSPIIDKVWPHIYIKLFTKFSNLLPQQILTSYRSHYLAFKKARIVISRSTNETTMLKRGFGVNNKKIRKVYNGVDAKYLKANSEIFRSKYNFKKFVLFAGQIGNRRKNLLRLIKVAKSLSYINFVFIGPILNNEHAKEITELSKESKNIYLLGFVSEEELISAYKACEVFVLPSIIEGTGLVALQAALAGAKVVITKNGGPPDYFGNLVEYIDPKSDKSIKEGILKSFNKAKDNKLKNYIRDNFLWEKVIRRLQEVYFEISN